MQMSLHRIVLAVFAMVLIVVCTSSSTNSAAHQPNDKAPAESKKEQPAIKLGKPDLSMDATAWYAEFKKDKNAAFKKYNGKLVELSGVVDRLDQFDANPPGLVVLKIQGETIGVACNVPDPMPWLRTSPGSKVKIVGRAKENAIYPGHLFPAEIADPGASTVHLAAKNIAKMQAAKPQETIEKYNGKWVILEGEVIEVTLENVIKLKGENKIVFHCDLCARPTKKSLETVKSAKPGQTIKLFGQLDIPDDTNSKPIRLDNCLFTELK